MFVIRPVKANDLDAIFDLACQTGIGLTNLPADKKVLKNKIARSVQSFKRDVTSPQDEYYLFVMEDLSDKKVVGTSAIDAAVGGDAPFYSYKLASVIRFCHELNLQREYKLLHLVNDLQGKSELCMLYLSKMYRQNGNGLLLSRSRLLFLADFSQRFADVVFAEMRGVSDKTKGSPFWRSLGQHFFDMPFAEADRLTAVTNKQFIADLMPRQPIYVNLLKKNAQAVIGKPHRSTVPAMKILQKEGFAYEHYVDIFDAGPTMITKLNNIKTIKQSEVVTIADVSDVATTKHYLMSNMQINYRVCSSTLEKLDKNTVRITPDAAKALNVKPGDTIRII